MNFYTKIILRSDWQNKNGTKTVCLRLTIKRKVKVISLKIKVFPNAWNSVNQIVLKRDADYLRKNKILQKYKSKAERITTDYFLNDKHLSFVEFEKQFFNESYGTNSFYEFIESELDKSKKKLAKATLKGYKSQLQKLKNYKRELNFTEIDFSFIRSYEVEMLQINNKNTVNKSLIFINTFLNKAINQGVFKGENPFVNYKISREQGVRDYLTISELNKLKGLYYSKNLKENKKNVLNYFLFSCYTGLRYKDIKELKFKNIKTDTYKDKNGTNKKINIIEIIMHKTKKPVRIPIIPEAEKLIHYPEIKNKNISVFDVLSSQPTNRYLKEFAKIVNIEKNVSFHVSRHTFATNALEFGIPMSIISQILGHSDIRVTQIYAKVSNKLKILEMMKMEK